MSVNSRKSVVLQKQCYHIYRIIISIYIDSLILYHIEEHVILEKYEQILIVLFFLPFCIFISILWSQDIEHIENNVIIYIASLCWIFIDSSVLYHIIVKRYEQIPIIIFFIHFCMFMSIVSLQHIENQFFLENNIIIYIASLYSIFIDLSTLYHIEQQVIMNRYEQILIVVFFLHFHNFYEYSIITTHRNLISNDKQCHHIYNIIVFNFYWFVNTL